MQLGRYDFEVFQLAYIDAYVHGQTELMAFIMHANFNNVRVGTVKSKLEFIKIVDFKIKNNRWYEKGSTYKYRNLAKHTVGDIHAFGLVFIALVIRPFQINDIPDIHAGVGREGDVRGGPRRALRRHLREEAADRDGPPLQPSA